MVDSTSSSNTIEQLYFDKFWSWAKPDPSTVVNVPSTWLDKFAAFVYDHAWSDCLTNTCNVLGKPPEAPAKLEPFKPTGDRRKG